MVRKTIHGDRGFVGRLAGLAVAQDFGAVGTFDPTGPQVNVVLKGGELGPIEGWVKKGDVFAAVRMQELRRSPRAKGAADSGPATTTVGYRVDGVLLQVVDAPRNGTCVCKVHNRYRSVPRDGSTVGYRCVRLGTGEGPLKLQLTDAAGSPYRGDLLQPRSGAEDFPDAPRTREEMTYAGGVFTSAESFKNIAFVLVKAGEVPIARIPIEIYPDQVAIRKVSVSDKLPSAVEAHTSDMLDRIRNARVMQNKVFEDLSSLQKKEKAKALTYGEKAFESLTNEAGVVRADLKRLMDRYAGDPAASQFEACEPELRNLEERTRFLRTHLSKLKDVIQSENNPAAASALGLINEAALAVKVYDYEVAIAKYEEAIKLTGLDAAARDDVQKQLDMLRKEWEPKDAEHAAARKFVYEVWAKLENPPDVKAALAEARTAMSKCKAVGDKITLNKMHLTAPQVFQRYSDNLKKMVEDAAGDADKLAEADSYLKVNDELGMLTTDLAKEVAGAGK